MTATSQTRLTAAEAWREVAARQIAITPALGLWTASVDEFGDGVSTRKRKVRSISATAASPMAAVRDLIAKLDVEAQEREMFDGDPYDY